MRTYAFQSVPKALPEAPARVHLWGAARAYLSGACCFIVVLVICVCYVIASLLLFVRVSVGLSARAVDVREVADGVAERGLADVRAADLLARHVLRRAPAIDR